MHVFLQSIKKKKTQIKIFCYQYLMKVLQVRQSLSPSNKYELPRIKTTREKVKFCESVNREQKRKDAIKNKLSESVNLRDKSKTSTIEKSSISQILKIVHKEFNTESNMKSQFSGLKLSNMGKIVRNPQSIQRQQKKLALQKSSSLVQPIDIKEYQEQCNEYLQRKLMMKQVIIQNKPPHRYKTKMVAYQSSLILFGGIGCDKNLTWAKLTFCPQKLQLPPKDLQQDIYKNNTPFYGHTMKAYKSNAYIYGGVNGDVLHQLFVLNLKTLSLKAGVPAPYRRKEHACTMVGRFMLVYGGIEGNETRNTLFYYDTESCQWTVLPSTIMPYLSHHSMITVPAKNKRKLNNISESNDVVYIFGGKNQKGEASNKLYKLKIIDDFEIKCQQVLPSDFSQPSPDERYSCCFEYLENGNILLYGGKDDTELHDLDVKNGTFRDVYLFNIYRRTWKKKDACADFRHSMASTSVGGKVYVFGGFGDTHYADANLTVMKLSQSGTSRSIRQEQETQEKQNTPCKELIRKLDFF